MVMAHCKRTICKRIVAVTLLTLGLTASAHSLARAENDVARPTESGKAAGSHGKARQAARKDRARQKHLARQARKSSSRSCVAAPPINLAGEGASIVTGRGAASWNIGSLAAPAAGSASGVSTGAGKASVGTFNKSILDFAVSRLGIRVGDGMCYALAEEALIQVGARPSIGTDFGREIPLSELLPGDILQFESARFQRPGAWMLLGSPQHTAIVGAVQGSRLIVLHQNFNSALVVQSTAINLAEITSGTVTAYRAVAK